MPAFASSWYYVDTDAGNRFNMYIDNDSVIKNTDYAIVWVKMIFQDGSSMITRVYFSRNHYEKSITALTYNADGCFIRKYNANDSAPKPITPDSLMDELYHLIWQ
jgi:hypothetical protein